MSDQEEEADEDAPNGVVPVAAASSNVGSAAAAKSQASGSAVPRSGGLTRNTNFDDVVRADKERRDKAKQDAQRKKEKDKEDRYIIFFLLSSS